MRFFLLILSISLLQSSFAQLPGITWNKRLGGSGNDRIASITRLNGGDYVCAGHSNSSDIPGTDYYGDNDFYIQCVSSEGQLKWKRLMGGTEQDGNSFTGNGEFVSATADGGFFFGGATASSNGDVDVQRGSFDLFIAKFDLNGNMEWRKTFGSDKSEYIAGIQATADGGCIIAATTDGNNNGDVPVNHSPGEFDTWIIKLDPIGNIQWSKMFGGSLREFASAIEITKDGNYVFAADVTSEDGDLAGSVNPGAVRKNDVWIVKLNSSGSIIWKKRFGGSESDENAVIHASAITNDIFISLNTRSTDIDFPVNLGLVDVAVLKLNDTGAVVWKKMIAGGAWDSRGDIVEDVNQQLYLTGITYSLTVNGFPIIQRGGGSDIFITRLDPQNGNPVWLTNLQGEGGDFPRAMLRTSNGETLIAGETNSASFDFPGSLGGEDGFLIKLSAMNVIKGLVYYDLNGNGTKEDNEPVVNNAQVRSTKSDGSYSTSSYTYDGNYANEADSGVFNTKLRLFNSSYYTASPDSFSTTFTGYYQTVTRNIAVRTLPGKRDIRTVLTTGDAARAGFESNYELICFNVGTDTVSSGLIKLVKDKRVQLLSASPVPISVSGDTLTWQYAGFKPLDTLSIRFKVRINTPPEVLIGDWLKYVSTITPLENDQKPGDNKFTLYHGVTGSFDPNDKNESHGTRYSTEELSNEEFLYYTIRFQNTGNDTAFNVVVRDTLDPQLNWETLEMIKSSHPQKLTVINGNKLSWEFKDIKLVDSNMNEPLSHGYITYRIKPGADVELGDTIRNSASIYFDFNLPIKTNTHFTIIKFPQPEKPQVTILSEYCGNQGIQKGKILNLPSAGTGAVVTVSLNGSNLPVAADSTFSFDVGTIGAGNLALVVKFENSTGQDTLTRIINIKVVSIPEVNISSNITSVVTLTNPVTLTATNAAGGGSSPLYTFATNRGFTNILQAESSANTHNLNLLNLFVGDNWIYVRMKTSETCFSSSTNTDSIKIFRDAVTGLTDPDNPGRVISIYPNPFEGRIVLSGLDQTKRYELRLTSLDGKLLMEKQIKNQSQFNFIVPDYPAGIYFLSVYDRKANHLIGTQRLVKQ